MEIERKFLVIGEDWKKSVTKTMNITQFYLTDLDQSPTVRLRIKGEKGYLTLKYPSQSDVALVREEFEYEIPVKDVLAQLPQAKSKVIKKVRHEIPGPDGLVWEIDEFSQPQSGLVVAEIELSGERDEIMLPDWTGKEVTQDPRYSNLHLSFNENWTDLSNTGKQ